jgi:uncharacterized protein
MKKRITIRILVLASLAIFLMMFGCAPIERRLLFYPSHHNSNNGLTPWTHQGQVIGFSQQATNTPKNIWLFFHGNAGQAADRDYVLPSFSREDSIYILEYPGYGQRKGVPSKASFNRAADEAYRLLRQTYPTTPICIASESIGSGPACHLAAQNPPPDKLVLIVPFAALADVARDHFPGFLVKLLLRQDWDNLAALKNYKGPIEIFAAKQDNIIRPSHARALADAIPNSKFILLDCGHNDWSSEESVKVRN